jgi:hypothetical protein
MIKTYLYDLERFFSGGNTWQASLIQQIEGLTLEQALWKPAPERHCIWDILLHINFWKQYAVALVRDTEKPDAESGNWSLAPSGGSEAQWQTELARARTVHDSVQAVATEMGDKLFDTEQKHSNMIRQIIMHDAYHTGQIGLLRALQGLPPIE